MGMFVANGQNNDLSAQEVTLKSVPLAIKVKEGPWSVRLGVSWLEIDSGTTVQSGQGDTTLSIGYDLSDTWRVTVKEKFATGDRNKGLSTGYNDTKVQLDGFTAIGQGRSLFGTVGYTFKGGQDANPDYRNAIYASIGAGFLLSPGWSSGLSVDYAQSTNRTLDDTLGASVFLGHRVNRQWGVNLFAGYDNTATQSLGVGISYRLQ